MRITQDGNVGIGTTSPSDYYSGADNLVVKQASGEGGISIVTANDTSGAIYFADGTTGSEQYRGGIGYTHSTDKLFLVSGGQTRAWMDTNGNVGIGTASPDNLLHIEGSITTAALQVNQTGAGVIANFKQGGSSKLLIDNSGNVGIGTTSPGAKLVVTDNNDGQDATFKVNHTRSDSDVATQAIEVSMTLSGADTTTADRVNSGILVDVVSTADGDTSNEHRLYGVFSDVTYSGMSDLVRGGYFKAESNNNTEKTAQTIGVYGQAVHDANSANGGVTTLAGVYGQASLQDTGDVSNTYGGFFLADIPDTRITDAKVVNVVEGHIDINKSTTISYGNMSAVSAVIDNNEGSVPNFSDQYLFKGDYQVTTGYNAYG